MTRCLSFFLLVALCGALPAQQLVITNPAAGAQVPVGTRCTIGWTNSGLAGRTLTISVTVDGNGVSVADLVPVEAGQYQWNIPWELAPTNPCQVSITAEGEGGETWRGSVFAIVPNTNPVLIVRAPVGGEQWPRGATRSVSWEPHNLTGTLTLDLLQGGAVVNSVSGIPVASNRFHYAIPAGLPVGSNYTFHLTSDSAPSATVTSRAFGVTAQAPATKPWTVLIYMDGDNNLERGVLEDLDDLGKLGNSTNINYVVQLDRTPGYVTNFGNWYDTRRFFVTNGTTPTPECALQNLGELDMASPETLTDFINWAVENYPAERYFLICGDHGDDLKGLLEDWTPTHRLMTTRQFQQALTAADAPMTILGLDMCEEGYVEIAYQLRNTGPEILIASQYMEDRDWAYRAVFQQLENRQGNLDNRALAILMCNASVAKYPPEQAGTLAVVLLDNVEALTDAVAPFADAMMRDPTDKLAIRAEAGNVAAAFHNVVLYCARTPGANYNVNGLNICFPMTPGISSGFLVQDFAADAHWLAFLTDYLQNLTNTWIGDARRLVEAPPGGDTSTDLLRFLEAINPNTTNAWVTFARVGEGSSSPVTDSSIIVGKGQSLMIRAEGSVSTNGPPTRNHFVRWWVSGDAQIGDPLAATNTLTVNGDALVMAFFSEDKESYQVTFLAQGNGSLNGTNELTVQVPAGGACPTVNAVADPGYAFSSWGGDYPASANPFTLTNVQSDMTVIGFFWPVRPTLAIERQGASVTLSWPANPPGYALESAANLSAGPWTPVAGVSTNSVTLPISSTNQFFRLRQGSDQNN